MNLKTIILLFSLTCLLPNAIAGNGYEIKKNIIGSGGGSSLGGSFKINGSVAQAVTDVSSGGNYKISSGFWHASTPLTESIFKNSFE